MTWVQRLADFENKMLDRSRSSKANEVATTPATGTIDDLGRQNYCVLVTYRKDGAPVPSPLWFGMSDGKLYFHTGGFKVKRVERNPDVLVAPSTFRGRPLGPPFAGTAHVLSPAEADASEHTLAKKYGLQRRLYLKLFGQEDLGVHVEVTPTVAE